VEPYELEPPPSDLQGVQANLIGEGAYGMVYKVRCWHCDVAAKKLRMQRISDKQRQAFEDEIHTMVALRHPNLVRLLGACLKPNNMCIVLEKVMIFLSMSL